MVEKANNWMGTSGSVSLGLAGSGAGAQTVLVGENGQIVGGAATGAGGGGSGGGTTTSSPSTASTSPFVINITYDASVGGAPAGFTAVIGQAVQFLESQYTDPVTINISVGYGEVGGSALGNGTLGASQTYLANYTYSQIYNALAADATTANDTTAVASLPGASPVPSANYWVSTAQAKALGLMGASSATDGFVGFSSTYAFDYNNADGVSAGTYDFYGTVLHELTEVMGRMLLTGVTLGGKANSYDPFDLFHYASAGVRNFSASTAGYFSIDGGTTNQGNFNTISGGDAGDWGSGMGNDAYNAYSNSGVVNAVSASDLVTLDAIGWNFASGTTTTPTGPGGVTFSGATYSAANATAGGLAAGAPIAIARQSGGPSGDSYSYTLGGADAGVFSLASASNVGSLAVGLSTLAGASTGRAYRLTVTATDTTTGLSSPASPLGVVVGTSGSDGINVQSVLGGTTPAFVYALAGADTVTGSGVSAKLWIAGGGGADTMTGGSGGNVYAYGAVGDSVAGAMDIITNFNAAADLLDLTGLATALGYAGQIGGGSRAALAPHSIGWQVSNGNTFIYVNTSGSTERLSAADMKIELAGRITLTSADFAHL